MSSASDKKPDFEAVREHAGHCVTGPGVYIHVRDVELAKAIAALLNGQPVAAAAFVDQWRNR